MPFLGGYVSSLEGSNYLLSGMILQVWGTVNNLTGWWFQTVFILFLPGEMIQFDDHIFQRGWNHQLAIYVELWAPGMS